MERFEDIDDDFEGDFGGKTVKNVSNLKEDVARKMMGDSTIVDDFGSQIHKETHKNPQKVRTDLSGSIAKSTPRDRVNSEEFDEGFEENHSSLKVPPVAETLDTASFVAHEKSANIRISPSHPDQVSNSEEKAERSELGKKTRGEEFAEDFEPGFKGDETGPSKNGSNGPETGSQQGGKVIKAGSSGQSPGPGPGQSEAGKGLPSLAGLAAQNRLLFRELETVNSRISDVLNAKALQKEREEAAKKKLPAPKSQSGTRQALERERQACEKLIEALRAESSQLDKELSSEGSASSLNALTSQITQTREEIRKLKAENHIAEGRNKKVENVLVTRQRDPRNANSIKSLMIDVDILVAKISEANLALEKIRAGHKELLERVRTEIPPESAEPLKDKPSEAKLASQQQVDQLLRTRRELEVTRALFATKKDSLRREIEAAEAKIAQLLLKIEDCASLIEKQTEWLEPSSSQNGTDTKTLHRETSLLEMSKPSSLNQSDPRTTKSKNKDSSVVDKNSPLPNVKKLANGVQLKDSSKLKPALSPTLSKERGISKEPQENALKTLLRETKEAKEAQSYISAKQLQPSPQIKLSVPEEKAETDLPPPVEEERAPSIPEELSSPPVEKHPSRDDDQGKPYLAFPKETVMDPLHGSTDEFDALLEKGRKPEAVEAPKSTKQIPILSSNVNSPSSKGAKYAFPADKGLIEKISDAGKENGKQKITSGKPLAKAEDSDFDFLN